MNEDNEYINSILTSIKKLLNIDKDCTDFDTDIIIHINTALSILNQLGVGKQNYRIESENNLWSEFIDEEKATDVKTYVYLKVRLIFDPPLNASVLESMKESIKELEWRLNVKFENNEEV